MIKIVSVNFKHNLTPHYIKISSQMKNVAVGKLYSSLSITKKIYLSINYLKQDVILSVKINQTNHL